MRNGGKILDLKKLHYFRHVAAHGSFRRAAQYLGMSQPALTRHVQDLEGDLGTALVQRRPAGVTLTEAGHFLTRRAEELLDLSTRTVDDIAGLKGQLAGPVTLAFPMSFTMSFLPRIIAALRERYPAVHLRVVEGSSRHIEDWLMDGTAEIGILVAPSGSRSLIEEVILKEEVMLLGMHDPGDGSPVSFATLARLPLVLPMPPHGTRKVLDRMAAREKVELCPRLEIDNPHTIRQVVLGGEFFTVQTPGIFAEEIRAGSVHAVRIEPRPVRELAIATLRGRSLSSAARVLASEIRRMLQDARDTDPAQSG